MKRLSMATTGPVIHRKTSLLHSLRLAISLALLLVTLLMLWALPARAVAEQAGGMPTSLRAGFLRRVFYDADLRDAKAALEVQGRQISRNLGLSNDTKVVIYPDTASMIDAVRRSELEMVTLPASEYLRIRDRVPLIPSFVSANNNGQGTRFVVIAHAESGIRSFSGMKGKTVLLTPIIRHDSGHIWLETMLMNTGKGGRDDFFGQVRESPKVPHAIMAVFLRQADAAIITRSGLDASRQLNPQLDSKLTVLAESRNLSDGVTCLIPSTSERFRANLSNAIMQLNGSRTGQQMFAMFQSSGITPFKPAYLEGLEELMREHDRLKSKRTKRK